MVFIAQILLENATYRTMPEGVYKKKYSIYTVLQIRMGKRINLRTILDIFRHKKTYLESSHRDASNDGSQHMFLSRKRKN